MVERKFVTAPESFQYPWICEADRPLPHILRPPGIVAVGAVLDVRVVPEKWERGARRGEKVGEDFAQRGLILVLSDSELKSCSRTRAGIQTLASDRPQLS